MHAVHAALGGGALIRDVKYLYNKSEAKLRGGLYSKGAYIRVSTVYLLDLVKGHPESVIQGIVVQL